ncbi:thiamine-phosphate kinase [Haliea sp. AH-315-K21]|nr:thiamine-phosphate kinase [Haliea sp. AH-315-K21]MBN4059815.1 thiamine-phosphate kinase [bacterium AH-315-I11]MBN4075520.1 thiamine-phosphate kinase [Gammaproteobacteria bacterium AH-315-E17]
MAISEFDLIKDYFNKSGLIPTTEQSARIPLGIGDDCAVIDLPPERLLAVSMDTLVADVHFPAKADSGLIAQRALAVNLSDLAAMGAEPLAFTLALSLPKVEEAWLQGFSLGLEQMIQKYRCPLIGGDITKGPLSITIQVHGLLERGKILRRDSARPGELVYVSGELGAAGLAVSLLGNGMSLDKPDTKELHSAYYQPVPRVILGQSIAGIASAAIDISDGLMADLGHIAEQSGVGIVLNAKAIPISKAVKNFMGAMGDKSKGLNLALTAGDEYELALTVAEDQQEELQQKAAEINVPLTLIGRVVKGSRVKCLDSDGREIDIKNSGYRHFS